MDDAEFAETYEGLTTRIAESLRARCSGLGRKEVARQLFIEDHTMRNHMSKILTAFGLGNRGHSTSGTSLLCYRLGRYDERRESCERPLCTESS